MEVDVELLLLGVDVLVVVLVDVLVVILLVEVVAVENAEFVDGFEQNKESFGMTSVSAEVVEVSWPLVVVVVGRPDGPLLEVVVDVGCELVLFEVAN